MKIFASPSADDPAHAGTGRRLPQGQYETHRRQNVLLVFRLLLERFFARRKEDFVVAFRLLRAHAFVVDLRLHLEFALLRAIRRAAPPFV